LARSTAIEVLEKCFSESEWKWLKEESSFLQAVKSLKSIDDIQNISRSGDNLIYLAEAGKHPAHRKPPEAPRRVAVTIHLWPTQRRKATKWRFSGFYRG
jgi:hypothetical protein